MSVHTDRQQLEAIKMALEGRYLMKAARLIDQRGAGSDIRAYTTNTDDALAWAKAEGIGLILYNHFNKDEWESEAHNIATEVVCSAGGSSLPLAICLAVCQALLNIDEAFPGWQPIETAPKCKKLLVWSPWIGMASIAECPVDGVWVTYYNGKIFSGDLMDMTDEIDFFANGPPTHWMHLPTPPEGT